MVPAGGGVYMRKAVKPKRTKKERFQDYLDKTGVSAAILRGIISLYEDDNKPNDPIRYLCEQWGFGIPEIEEVDSLQAEVIQLREYFHQLTAETEELKILTKLKPTLEQELGLDEETQELLRKQGDELTRIQQREACFLKAFELSKIQERAKSKVKSKACAPFGPTEVGGDEGTPTLCKPLNLKCFQFLLKTIADLSNLFCDQGTKKKGREGKSHSSSHPPQLQSSTVLKTCWKMRKWPPGRLRAPRRIRPSPLPSQWKKSKINPVILVDSEFRALRNAQFHFEIIHFWIY